MFGGMDYDKLFGILSGSVLALVFLVPRSWAGFARRLVMSLIGGFIFTTPAREYLGWAETGEYVAAAACISSFLSWWVMGAITKALETFEIFGSKSD